jgi:iron complex outermembrane receptor protein
MKHFAVLNASVATMLIGLSSHAMAQTTPVTPGSEQPTADIVVTGSRIKAPNLLNSSPVVSVSSKEILMQGTTNVETLLNDLPQISGSNTGNQSTFGTPGIATVNLRNLGPARTLVMIDGRRLAPGDPNQPFADLNFVPSLLVSSVEVLTGGASAVYGSDAVAGVVNFKMKRDLNGVILDYQFSGNQHDNDDGTAQSQLNAFGVAVPGNKFDGFTHNATIAAGINTPDGKGNITAYFGYRNTAPVSASSRDFSACGIGTMTGANPFDTHACSGSSTSAFGRFRKGGTGAGLAANPNGTATFVPYTGALAYNSAQETYLQRSDQRYTGGVFAHYQASPALDLYTDVMIMADKTRAQIAPAGIVSNVTYNINCDNPLLSGAQATQLCGVNAGEAGSSWSGTIGKRLVVPGRDRYYDIRHTDFRMVGGARGDLGAGWSYDVYAQYSISDYKNYETNDVSVSRVQDALLVRNVNGTAQCISGNVGCAPLNIFQLGQISEAAADYVFASGTQNGSVTQAVLSGTLNGNLGQWGIQSPWASRPVSIAIGAEYRRDAISLHSSPNIISGDLAGFGATAPASGSTHVGEIFIESLIPLASDMHLIHDLSLDVAYRYSDYNLAGGTNTYKGSLIYAPSRDISFRGGYNRAVRAPSVVELFAPQSRGTASVTDSCAGSSPTATLVQCERSGVTAAQYGLIADCTSNFCSTQVGGNLGLKPETADTITAGGVLTPRFIPGLLLSVDYFNIKVKNLIGTVPATLTLSQCLNSGSEFYCGLIKRDSNGGLGTTSGYIVNTNVNTGFLKTSGLDVSVAYRVPFENLGLGNAGAITLSMNGSWVHDRSVSPLPGQPAYDCAGLFGPTCGVPSPKWRHNARVTWETPWKALISLNWRYIGPTNVDINEGNSAFTGVTGGLKDIADARIHPYSYFDLSGSVTVMENFTLRVGVTNLMDKDPPIVDQLSLGVNAQYGSGNTFPGLYDVLGRTIFAGITAKF